jgi:hypothetical protein
MTDDQPTLAEFWQVRNAAAATLALSEQQMRRAIRAASVEQLVSLIESFAPARSAGPEWTRTFDPLVERLWAWRDDATIAALAEVFRARGAPWLAVTNALAPDNGTRTHAASRQPAWARLPVVAMV